MPKSLQILIVEDSEDDAVLLLRHLKQDGYEPVCQRVDNSVDLLAALEKQPWDIVISDYVLPSFSGLEVLKILEETKLDIPCIIVSGQINDEIAVAAMKAGASDYLMKDNLKRLGAAIERELAEANVRRARRRAEEQTRALSRRLLVVQEEERRNIARELHDQLGQSLTGLKLMLTQVTRSGQANSPVMEEAMSVVTELIQQVREMSLRLRPSMLDDIGLLSTLLWHFQRFTAQTQVKVNFTHHGLERNLGSDASTVVYRIVQEALTNVARYAKVNEVDVTIEVSRENISLEIKDRGSGFDIATITAKASTGLSGMRERAQLLGGTLTIESRQGSGTRINVELPIMV